MDKSFPKVLLFIPTFQCQEQIQRVLLKISTEIQKEIELILLVDNISKDKTIENVILSSGRIQSCKFLVLKNKENYGLGGSHKIAFRYALENEFDYILVLHGDDQANIEDAINLLINKQYLNFDCYLGSRFMRDSKLIGYSAFRKAGNFIFNKLFTILAGQNIFDLGSGLNMYRLKAFKDWEFMQYPDDLVFNYVMLLNSCIKKQSIYFFPITWTEEDQISNVKFVSHCLKVLHIWITCIFNKKKFTRRKWTSRIKIEYQSIEIFSSGPT